MDSERASALDALKRQRASISGFDSATPPQMQQTDFGADTRLVRYFYNFLTGISNRLPSYESIYKIIEKSKDGFSYTSSKTVSQGYGMILKWDGVNFELFYEDSIADGITYFEKITEVEHTTNVVLTKPSTNYAVAVDIENLSESVKSRIVPLNIDRVKYLQAYLKECFDKYKSEENQAGGMKK